MRSAERYVELAEEESGAIPAPVGPAYVWGDALAALEAQQPRARIVTLETAVTVSYGFADLLNDYEAIGGHEEFRPELSLLYLPSLEANGALAELEPVPMRIRRFRLDRASGNEARWLANRLTQEGESLGTRVVSTGDGSLSLRWG